MHILIGLVVGLAVITLLIIGWLNGSLFASVFLSLPPAAYLMIACLQQSSGNNRFYPGWVLICVGTICIVWMPRYLWMRAHHRPWRARPVKSQSAYDAGVAFANGLFRDDTIRAKATTVLRIAGPVSGPASER